MAVTLAACGGEMRAPAARSTTTPAPATATPAPTPTPMPTPTPAPTLPSPVRVGPLPEAGIVVSARKAVRFLDVYGRVVRELGGVTVAGNPGAPGVWLQRGRDHFRLAAGRGLLVPVPRGLARDRMYGETEPRGLRPPEEARGPVPGSGFSGRWRYAHEGPRGVVLAQWSGECEIPSAYWKAPGRRPELVTGGHDLAYAPNSIALGWTADGRALVQLQHAGCGTAHDAPGIYAFTSPGIGVLLCETPAPSLADMWGTAG